MSIDWEDNKNLIGVSGTALGSLIANQNCKVNAQVEGEKINSVLEVAENILSKTTNLKQKGVHIENIPNSGCAYYGTVSKTIGIDMQKNALSIFHEIGHAQIFDKYNMLTKLPLGANQAIFLSIATAIAPAIMDKFNIGNYDVQDKAWNVSPFIIGGIWLPIIINEGMASIKGQNMAKPFLDKVMYKSMKQANIAGLLSYIFTGAASILLSKLVRERFE
jgi:hypothetical protein